MPRPRLLLLPLLVIAFGGGAAAPAMGAATSYSTIDQFKGAVPGRSVNWDDRAAPGDVPVDAYAAQGMLLGAPGLVVGEDAQHPAYSHPNVFQTNGSTVTTVSFVVPGSTTPGVVRGFGAYFSNVTASNPSKLELLDSQNKVIASTQAPVATGRLVFVGLAFPDARVVRARITAGTTEGTTVLDDFVYGEPQPDRDGDGVPDATDNCPAVANPDQGNVDKDSQGDACDPDADNDGVPNSRDAFPLDKTETVDTDGDGIGDNADPDDDNDGLSDRTEGRLGTDPKRADTDGDGVNDGQDNCPTVSNADQADSDGDGHGDACQDMVPPVLSKLTLQPARFRRGSKNGTRVSFRIDKAGRVDLTVVTLAKGHREGGRCVRGAPITTIEKKHHRVLATQRPCDISKPIPGTIERSASPGTNFVKFDGRIGGRWIASGRYALVASATDSAGIAAPKPVRATFKILP